MTLKLININCFRLSLLHLCRIFYKATSVINWVKGIISVLALANKILNQTLNIHIQNYPVEGISKKIKS